MNALEKFNDWQIILMQLPCNWHLCGFLNDCNRDCPFRLSLIISYKITIALSNPWLELADMELRIRTIPLFACKAGLCAVQHTILRRDSHIQAYHCVIKGKPSDHTSL